MVAPLDEIKEAQRLHETIARIADDVGIEEQFSGCLQVTSIFPPELKGQLGENILVDTKTS